MRLNVGQGPHYAEGWTNTDLVSYPGIEGPDVFVTREDPFPFDDHTVERAYLGHILEHVPWSDTPAFLTELRRILTPDAEVCFVGPDVLEAVRLYKLDLVPWWLVMACIEGSGAYLQDVDEWEPLQWGGDRHHWDCHQDRVVALLVSEGWSVDVVARDRNGNLDGERLIGEGWPLVSAACAQFAIVARP